MAPNAYLLLITIVLIILLLERVCWFLTLFVAREAGPVAQRLAGVWRQTHPVRSALAQRYPKTYSVTRERLTPERFSGLPLTLLIAAALYMLFLASGLVEALLEAEELTKFDEAVTRFLAAFRETPALELFKWITDLGAAPALLSTGIVATGFLWSHKRRLFILPLWIAFLGAEMTTWLGKFGFDRVRPDAIPGLIHVSPAFPSAHATGAMAIFGFVAYAVARDLLGIRERFSVIFWAGVLITLIGFSRVFLGAHHLSDVLMGFVVGGFWLLAGFAVTEYRRAL